MALASQRLTQFAVNASWGVLSVVVNLVAGLLMAPYLISKLGEDGYGVWSLIFVVAGYFTFLDFGFRSAVVNFTARALAEQNIERINALLSTGLAYSLAIMLGLLVTVGFLTPWSPGLLGIDAKFSGQFPLLFFLVSAGFAVSFPFTIVSGCIEGFQHYASLRRLQTGVLGLRTIAYFLVLWMGGGLLALVFCTVSSFLALITGYALILRSVFPQLQLRRGLIRKDVLKDMLQFGIHTNTNTVATLLLEQTPPVLISRSLSDESVGYFTLPLRIAQIPLNMIRSVADMLTPLAAEYTVRKEYAALARIAVLSNRYSFVLYAPVALLLLAWGTDIVHLWLGQKYSLNAGPLLFYSTLGAWIALAGQGATIGILFGVRAHHWCAWGLLAEAAVVVAVTAALAQHSLVLVTAYSCLAMVANRGLFSAWALCRNLNVPLGPYLWSVYGVPSLLAAPVYFFLVWLAAWFPADKRWIDVVLAGAMGAILYLIPAVWLCIDQTHRQLAIGSLQRYLPWRKTLQ
jgi:O-antigen/teichoic acid export membrane protein